MAKNVDVAAVLGAQIPAVSDSDTGVKLIPIGDITSNSKNFYPQYSAPELDDLMESIKVNGLLEPLTVVSSGPLYRIISGHNRYFAISLLHTMEPKNPAYQRIACKVLPAMDEDKEACAIIEANRQRIKTPYVLQQEVERLTASYIKRKEAGEDLPGKIRDRVAKALQISATHAAQLQAIENNLKVPGFEDRYRKNEISESVAYEISKLDHDAQYRYLDYTIDKNISPSISSVRKFNSMYVFACEKCPHTGKMCGNAEAMYDHSYHNGEWHCAGCCEQCLNRNSCQAACKYIPKPVETATTESHAEHNHALRDPRADYHNIIHAFTARLKQLRIDTGLSKKEFSQSIDRYPNTYSAWENNSIPGSETVPLLALALGCTTDYLYGLTEDKTGSVAPWRGFLRLDLDHWPSEGKLVVLAYENSIGGYHYQLARCVGGYGEEYPFIDPNSDLTCEDFDDFTHWSPMEEMRHD